MNSKVAIVTGAGSGIGRSVALAMLKDGFKVSIAGRRAEALEETAKQAPDRSNLLIVPTDVSQPSSVRKLFAATKDEFRRVDILFNNAGINTADVLFEDLSFDQWKSVVDVNLNGAFLCAREAFKIMKAQNPIGGRIINNGSISAQVPRPNSAPYTATKHAITGLTRSTALDGRKYNIACGQIDIGNAATGLASKMTQGVPQADGSTAPEPIMNVSNVADAVIYMANLPSEANVLFMTVMATNMPFVGRG